MQDLWRTVATSPPATSQISHLFTYSLWGALSGIQLVRSHQYARSSLVVVRGV